MSMPPSLWSLKPWWCQPWSIVATGLAGIGGSWWWLHRWWLTLPVSVLVLIWWWLFLVLAPVAYRQAVLTGGPQGEGEPGSAEGSSSQP